MNCGGINILQNENTETFISFLKYSQASRKRTPLGPEKVPP